MRPRSWQTNLRSGPEGVQRLMRTSGRPWLIWTWCWASRRGCGWTPSFWWREEYTDVLRRIADAGARRVILGTLRGLQRMINFRKRGYDTSWVEYLKVNTPWGKKMPDEKRREVYGFCIDVLRDCGFRGDIGICKETAEMVKEFGMDEKMRCNCAW
jgi:hypothetical protein